MLNREKITETTETKISYNTVSKLKVDEFSNFNANNDEIAAKCNKNTTQQHFPVTTDEWVNFQNDDVYVEQLREPGELKLK